MTRPDDAGERCLVSTDPEMGQTCGESQLEVEFWCNYCLRTALAAKQRECERLRKYKEHHEFVGTQLKHLFGGEVKTLGDLEAAAKDLYDKLKAAESRLAALEHERDEALMAAETTAPGRLWLAQRRAHVAREEEWRRQMKALRKAGDALAASVEAGLSPYKRMMAAKAYRRASEEE